MFAPDTLSATAWLPASGKSSKNHRAIPWGNSGPHKLTVQLGLFYLSWLAGVGQGALQFSYPGFDSCWPRLDRTFVHNTTGLAITGAVAVEHPQPDREKGPVLVELADGQVAMTLYSACNLDVTESSPGCRALTIPTRPASRRVVVGRPLRTTHLGAALLVLRMPGTMLDRQPPLGVALMWATFMTVSWPSGTGSLEVGTRAPAVLLGVLGPGNRVFEAVSTLGGPLTTRGFWNPRTLAWRALGRGPPLIHFPLINTMAPLGEHPGSRTRLTRFLTGTTGLVHCWESRTSQPRQFGTMTARGMTRRPMGISSMILSRQQCQQGVHLMWRWIVQGKPRLALDTRAHQARAVGMRNRLEGPWMMRAHGLLTMLPSDWWRATSRQPIVHRYIGN